MVYICCLQEINYYYLFILLYIYCFTDGQLHSDNESSESSESSSMSTARQLLLTEIKPLKKMVPSCHKLGESCNCRRKIVDSSFLVKLCSYINLFFNILL